MKKFLCAFLLFAATAFSTISACSPAFFAYYKRDNKIYYGIPERTDSTYRTELVGVDTAGFEYEKYNSPFYASSKTHIFHQGRAIEGLNPATAKFLGGTNAQIGPNGYIKDEQNVFFLGKKVENADAASFEALPAKYPFGGFAKDKYHIFSADKMIERDVATFQLLEEGYSMDKNGIYFFDNLLPDANPNDYKQNKYFLITNGKIYLNGMKLTKYDYNTFEILNIFDSGTSCGDYGYSASMVKDKTGMYLYDKKVPNIDPNSFELIKDTGVMKDKNGYYVMDDSWNSTANNSNYRFKRLKLNVATTQIDTVQLYTTRTFLWDKKRVFMADHNDVRDLTEQCGVDAATFKPYARIDELMLFKDRYRLYELNWVTLTEIDHFSLYNAKLVNMNKESICIKNNKKILILDRLSRIGIDQADPLTFNYAVGAKIDIKGKEYSQVHFDKKSIYYNMSSSEIRSISSEEYKHLQENIIQPEEVERQRLKSLGREYKF